MKKVIISLLFLALPLFAHPQSVVGDSIVLSVEEARTLLKMTEDLKYTKQELRMCDSVITHKDSIISIQDKMMKVKDTTAKRRARKIGLLSGGIGTIIGLIIGGLAL